MAGARSCPSCGSLESGDSLFCSRCGHSLGEVRRHERRAQVTIVFCDLAGSTALGERLDPEVLRGVQERYFAAAAGALKAHGGQVEKFIGDAVMCVFGLPAANEDDALRAVRGALDLRDGIAQLNADLRDELGIELTVRVGVNTGEVVAGDHATGQALVTGDAVNTAARLEQAAPAGGILIGELTHRLLAGAARVEWAEPITAKGKSEPVPAWLVLGLASGPLDLVRPAQRLVGRDVELAALCDRLGRVSRSRTAELVIVCGDPGIGKSALVAELLVDVAAGGVVSGACPSYGRGNTYRPLRDMLETVAPFPPEQSLARLLADEPEAPAIAERLCRLAGYAVGPVTREEAFDAVARLLSALARETPVIVVIEDLHWAEPTLLELLRFLAESIEAPVLLIGTARQELFGAHPDLAPTALQLDPLPLEAAVALLAGRHGLSPADSASVVARADGNPLFLEQLGAAFEEGAERIPADLAGLIASRLDRLDAEARSALEAAAIVGREFWPAALAPLLEHEHEVRSLAVTLEQLEAREFVGRGKSDALAEPTGLSGVFGGDRLHFRHALVHDAVLGTMSKGHRADLHEHFAAGLRRHARHEPAVVGYHLEQAARLRMELRPRDPSPPVAAKAAEQLEQAGLLALDRDDAAAASNLLLRARELLPPSAARRAEIDAALERSRAPRVAARTDDLGAGEELGGFVIERIAGRGGMATVYRARDPQLERAVALKVIAPVLANELSFRARFVRESRIAASIDHPGVIPVYRAGEDRGRLYIAMRYVDGGDLAALVHERGRLPVGEAVEIVAKLAGALDAAHARGLVHRDVKPANALLEGQRGERVYLTDFGLSSDHHATGGLTQVGQWVGTVAYSAPEQVRGEEVDARADVYALGGLLYTLVTGAVPFPASSEAEALAAHLLEPPPRPSRLVHGVPRALDAVVARALEKDPAHRFPSAGDLARAATAAARGARIPADTGSVASGAAAPRSGAPQRARTRRAAGAGRRLVLAGSVVIVALVAAAIAVVLIVGAGGGGPGNPAGRISGAALNLDLSPDRLSSAEGAVWALQSGGGILARVDARTRAVRSVPEPFDLGGRAHPDIAAATNVAWVTSSAASVGGVDRVPEAASGDGATHVPLASAKAVAVGPGAVWATTDPGSGKNGSVVRIDARSARITKRRIVGPRLADVIFAGDSVWVAMTGRGEVVRLNATTLAESGRVHLASGISRLAVDGTSLWVLNKVTRTVSRVDIRSVESVGVPIALGKELQDIAAGGGSLWIASSDSTVTRLDSKGAQIGTPIIVGAAPLSLAAEGAGVWVASGGDNSLVSISAD